MLSYDDGITSAVYTYDKNNRKLTETVDYGDFNLGHIYTYYANSLKQSFIGPDGDTYTYTYDENNQLYSMNIPGVGDIIFENDAWNRPAKKILPGGITQSYEYDPLMRIKRILSMTVNSAIIMDYQYAYDLTGNIVQKDTDHGAYVYGYDELNQLTSADNPDFEDESFTYDASGNRKSSANTKTVWGYNSNNELTDYNDVTLLYDGNGSMTGKTEGSVTTNYLFNVENRISKVKDQTGSTIGEYYYDPFGRRLWKDVDGVKTCFYYSDEGLIGKFDGNGAWEKTIGFKPNTTWTTEPLMMKIEGNVYFYQNDHLGTPNIIIDNDGLTIQSVKYSAFGNRKGEVDNDQIELAFPGQYFDSETNLFYNNNRYYDSTLARYLSRDPMNISSAKSEKNTKWNGMYFDVNGRTLNPYNFLLEFPAYNHSYLYSLNNSITNYDPYGLFSLFCTWVGVEPLEELSKTNWKKFNTPNVQNQINSALGGEVTYGRWIQFYRKINYRQIGYWDCWCTGKSKMGVRKWRDTQYEWLWCPKSPNARYRVSVMTCPVGRLPK